MSAFMTALMPVHRLHHQRQAARHMSGLSLVELLVGLAIGLLALLVILQVSAVFEVRRRATVAGSDAQVNGVQVLMAIERDLRLAGYGLGPASAQGCHVKRYFSAAQPDLILQAVTLTDGVNGGPDRVHILASTAPESGVATTLVAPHSGETSQMMVNSTLGIKAGDLLILHEAGKPCALIQASNVPAGDFLVMHEAANTLWNPQSALSLFPPGGYGKDSEVINAGALLDHRYSLDQANQLVLSRGVSNENTRIESQLATEIINLQAQYGFDTRIGSQITPQVNWWSDGLIDADGDGVVGNSGDLQRIYAIRFALVARSTQGGPGCATQTAPVWLAGASDGQLLETPITVGTHPVGKCYRFQVFQSVVPLRNRLWGDA